jgi:two-component system, NtrC family, sensor kinase
MAMGRNSDSSGESAEKRTDNISGEPAADVARLIRERDDALERQTATAEILSSISNATTDPRPVFDAILRNLLRLFGTKFATVLLARGGTLELAGIRGEEGFESMAHGYPRPLDDTTFIGRAIIAGHAMQVVPVVGNPAAGLNTERWGREFGFNALISVPLIRQGEVIGGISTAHRDPITFTAKQVELIESFADQAVIAIENVRLFDEVQAKTLDLSEALQQQTATADVLKAISRSAFDLESVLTTLTESAKLLCGAASGVIFRREGDVYRYAASTMDVNPAYREHEQQVAIQADRGTLIGRVALERSAVQIEDAWTDPEYKEKSEARLGNVRAMLGVPLMLSGEPIGAFALARRDPVSFSQRQVELVTTFADQAVIAIENARLFEEVQQRTKELSLSLDELRTAQDRLVQTEKLGAPGQTPAGGAP